MCKGTNNISEIGKYFKGNNGGNYLPKTAEFLFASFNFQATIHKFSTFLSVDFV